MPLTELGPQSVLMKDPTEYSSGINKLVSGKLDPRILRCIINSGKGMALHDSTYSKTCASPLQGVTLDLKVDAANNRVYDNSGLGNEPTLSNVTLVTGEMQFNGSTSFASIPVNSNYQTSSFSIYTRVKISSFTSNNYILDCSGSGGFKLFISATNGQVFCDISNSTNNYVNAYGIGFLTLNAVSEIVVTYEQYAGSNYGRIIIYTNGTSSQFENVYIYTPAVNSMTIGANKAHNNYWLNGSIYALQMFDHALSPSEVKALSDQRTALYPSQDSLDLSEIQTSVKDLQWFARNPTSTIETNPIIIVDSNPAAFWGSPILSGSGTGNVTNVHSVVINGRNYLQFQTTATGGSYTYWDFRYIYGSAQNWSSKDILTVDVYGSNSGQSITFIVSSSSNFDDSNYYYYSITDDFAGWQRFSILFGLMSVNGTPSLSSIMSVGFKRNTNPFINATICVGRMIVDVCPSIPVKKLSIDGLYLENQLEESPVASDISVIADDGQASFWTAVSRCSTNKQHRLAFAGKRCRLLKNESWRFSSLDSVHELQLWHCRKLVDL